MTRKDVGLSRTERPNSAGRLPPAPPSQGHVKLPLRQVVFDPDLLRLNLGIFILHMVQMAMFVALRVVLG